MSINSNSLQVTASEILPLGIEIGIKNGKISCLGTDLKRSVNTKIIDAEHGYITPGGVDSHVHLAQENSPTGDDWITGSRSAIAGGSTTILAFASQSQSDTSVLDVVSNYHLLAKNQSYCDYGFHLILTNPTPTIMKEEMPILISQGITSVKLYMTYEPMKLDDKRLLDVLVAARALGFTTMVHAENHEIISLITSRLEEAGHTEPYYHAVSRPQIAENEATYRIIALAELTDVPILIVHMSSEIAMKHVSPVIQPQSRSIKTNQEFKVRKAQTRLLPIHAETCPQYLFLLSSKLKGDAHDHFSGAKHVCSPPLRHLPSDLTAIWRGISNGTFTTFSSDHAPSAYSSPLGKKLGLVTLPDGTQTMCFSKIPNGLPGIETRLPLLFSYSYGPDAKLTLQKFVEITSTNPAKLYGLDGVKGSIAPGYDADLVIWYPEEGGKGETVIEQEMLHHGVDYTPYEGMKVRNWPRWTILRGKVVWDRDEKGVVGEVGDGKFLKRGLGKIIQGTMGNTATGMLDGERELWI